MIKSMQRPALVFLAAAASCFGQSASVQWVQTLGGSASAAVAGVATDAQGNSYVAGNTTSVDLPVRGAAQAHPGGSGLYRIDGAGRLLRDKLERPILNSLDIPMPLGIALSILPALAIYRLRPFLYNTWPRIPYSSRPHASVLGCRRCRLDLWHSQSLPWESPYSACTSFGAA
jgi:hypothetical protein